MSYKLFLCSSSFCRLVAEVYLLIHLKVGTFQWKNALYMWAQDELKNVNNLSLSAGRRRHTVIYANRGADLGKLLSIAPVDLLAHF